ncbi:MAG: hypothetical protein GY859_39145, partial [Desulfobacterales bacterium]|nr:hypothetical protein [Desulfobacterales bacterium]
WEESPENTGRPGAWDQLAGSVIIGVKPGQLPGGMDSALEALLEKPDGESVELNMKNRIWSGSFFRLIDAGGRNVGAVSVLLDRTERMAGSNHITVALAASCFSVGGALLLFFNFFVGRVETRRRESAALLKREMAGRERLAQKLIIQKRMADVGQLAATAAHEIRNPLGTVRAALYTINRRGRGKGLKISRTLDIASRSILRCDRIIEELLDYTRTTEPRMERVSLDDWLDQTLDELTTPETIAVERRLESNVEAR